MIGFEPPCMLDFLTKWPLHVFQSFFEQMLLLWSHLLSNQGLWVEHTLSTLPQLLSGLLFAGVIEYLG